MKSSFSSKGSCIQFQSIKKEDIPKCELLSKKNGVSPGSQEKGKKNGEENKLQ